MTTKNKLNVQAVVALSKERDRSVEISNLSYNLDTAAQSIVGDDYLDLIESQSTDEDTGRFFNALIKRIRALPAEDEANKKLDIMLYTYKHSNPANMMAVIRIARDALKICEANSEENVSLKSALKSAERELSSVVRRNKDLEIMNEGKSKLLREKDADIDEALSMAAMEEAEKNRYKALAEATNTTLLNKRDAVVANALNRIKGFTTKQLQKSSGASYSCVCSVLRDLYSSNKLDRSRKGREWFYNQK